jgi:hypothetical protein
MGEYRDTRPESDQQHLHNRVSPDCVSPDHVSPDRVLPQILTAPSLPLPDVDDIDDIEWQRFTQGDNLAAELLCNIIKANT